MCPQHCLLFDVTDLSRLARHRPTPWIDLPLLLGENDVVDGCKWPIRDGWGVAGRDTNEAFGRLGGVLAHLSSGGWGFRAAVGVRV